MYSSVVTQTAKLTLGTVDFHGHTLTVITGQNSEHLVAMKPICEAIGLSWRGQNERIQRHEVLREGMRVIRLPSSGGEQETICLDINYLNSWLFGVDSTRVKPEIRPRLIQYQRECFHVLAAYWQQGEATNPRKPQKPNSLTGALTEEQQSIIRDLVRNYLETLPKEQQGAAARKCWGSLTKSFACKSYKDIPAEQFSEAVSLLSRRFLEEEFLGKAPEQPAITLSQFDLAMLYTFSSAAMQLCDMGERLKPAIEALRPMALFGVHARLESCRLAVGYFYNHMGPQMEAVARQEKLYNEWMDLGAAEDPSRPIIKL